MPQPPAPDVRGPADDPVARALARLPRYPGMADLLEAFGGKDPLLDAYVLGHLPQEVERVVETNYAQLLCWLTARQLRLALGPGGPGKGG